MRFDASRQVVLSGEAFGSWAEVVHSGSDMGGQGFGSYHTRMKASALSADAKRVTRDSQRVAHL